MYMVTLGEITTPVPIRNFLKIQSSFQNMPFQDFEAPQTIPIPTRKYPKMQRSVQNMYFLYGSSHVTLVISCYSCLSMAGLRPSFFLITRGFALWIHLMLLLSSDATLVF